MQPEWLREKMAFVCKGRPMKARKLLENATLGPDEVKAVGKAFDDAWEQIKSHYQSNPQSIEVARLRLANAVLAAYREGLVDVDLIKARALDRLGH